MVATATLKTLPEPQKPDVDATVEHLTGVAQHLATSAGLAHAFPAHSVLVAL